MSLCINKGYITYVFLNVLLMYLVNFEQFTTFPVMKGRTRALY